ncbi:MAG: PASTA domain-containing protein [Clostridiales bacterium]|nr:PASTA domain-containing protein [Clostridiales bacterium]
MRMINCKKCGKSMDADLGMCPNCGAMYYILSDGETPDSPQTDNGAAFSENQQPLDNDDLFNTRVLNPQQTDETQVFKTTPQQTAPPPVHKSAPPRPVSSAHRQESRHGGGGDKRPNSLKKQLAVAAVALIALLTLVISIMSGLFNFNKNEDQINRMPQLVGQTDATAVMLLESMGIKVETMLERDETLEGTVIRQSVKEGKKLKDGELVILTISKGPEDKGESSTETEYVTVPNVLSKTYEQALKEITQAGLVATRAEDIFSPVNQGRVVSQNPLEGAKLQKGDIVTVTVSKGEEPSPSPAGHTITVTAGIGGSISPKGLIIVEEGKDQTFTITPDSGYEIRELKVDGTSIGAVSTYTFTKVTGDHTIYAVFQLKKEPTPAPTPTPTPAPPPTPTSPPEPEGQGE